MAFSATAVNSHTLQLRFDQPTDLDQASTAIIARYNKKPLPDAPRASLGITRPINHYHISFEARGKHTPNYQLESLTLTTFTLTMRSGTHVLDSRLLAEHLSYEPPPEEKRPVA